MNLLNQLYEVEKKADINSIVKKIQRLTDSNWHTKSLIVLAKEILKDEKLVSALNKIQKSHEEVGYLTTEDGKARREIYDKAMEAAKKILSSEDFAKVQGAF